MVGRGETHSHSPASLSGASPLHRQSIFQQLQSPQSHVGILPLSSGGFAPTTPSDTTSSILEQGRRQGIPSSGHSIATEVSRSLDTSRTSQTRDQPAAKRHKSSDLSNTVTHGLGPALAPVVSATIPAKTSSLGSKEPGNDLMLQHWALPRHEQKAFWKRQLCNLLPSRSQCDMFVLYYTENINWIFQTVHVPSFRKEYAAFWDSDVNDINLIWLSLLLTAMSVSALYLPPSAGEMVGFPAHELRDAAHIWHSASRQALHAGGYEHKPCLTQLQTFGVTQFYWYAMNKTEALSSALGQAVRTAHSLGLHKCTSPSASLADEMKHRIWWDICNADTFQAACMDRPTLIQCRFSSVPFPANCNDADITDTGVSPHPIDEPTEMSLSIFRARFHKVFNKLFMDDGSLVLSYEHVRRVDGEITALLADLPWFARVDPDALEGEACNPATALKGPLECVAWQVYLLHTCICTNRMRMYRPFLHPPQGDALRECAAAAESAFLTYRALRSSNSHKFFAPAYQIFLVGTALAAFLIVERGTTSATRLRRDVEMAIDDLAPLDTAETRVSLASNGRKVLRRMLAIHDQHEGALSPEEPEELVQAISDVFGGELQARRYLSRCKIRELLNSSLEQPRRTHDGAPGEPVSPGWLVSTDLTGSAAPDEQSDGTTGALQSITNALSSVGDYNIGLIDSIIPPDVLNWWPEGPESAAWDLSNGDFDFNVT